jgi:hypothetical protein
VSLFPVPPAIQIVDPPLLRGKPSILIPRSPEVTATNIYLQLNHTFAVILSRSVHQVTYLAGAGPRSPRWLSIG